MQAYYVCKINTNL